MPRVTYGLSEEKKLEAKRKAFCDWIRGELSRQEIKQEELANWLSMTQPSVSTKLREGNFTIEQALIIFRQLHAEPETVAMLFAWGGAR